MQAHKSVCRLPTTPSPASTARETATDPASKRHRIEASQRTLRHQEVMAIDRPWGIIVSHAPTPMERSGQTRSHDDGARTPACRVGLSPHQHAPLSRALLSDITAKMRCRRSPTACAMSSSFLRCVQAQPLTSDHECCWCAAHDNQRHLLSFVSYMTKRQPIIACSSRHPHPLGPGRQFY